MLKLQLKVNANCCNATTLHDEFFLVTKATKTANLKFSSPLPPQIFITFLEIGENVTNC